MLSDCDSLGEWPPVDGLQLLPRPWVGGVCTHVLAPRCGTRDGGICEQMEHDRHGFRASPTMIWPTRTMEGHDVPGRHSASRCTLPAVHLLLALWTSDDIGCYGL